MEKKILKAIEEAYRKGLKDAEVLNDIRPYLLTSQVVARELANKFCQTLVVGRSEQLKAFADYAQKRMWEDGDKDFSEFVDEFLRL